METIYNIITRIIQNKNELNIYFENLMVLLKWDQNGNAERDKLGHCYDQ